MSQGQHDFTAIHMEEAPAPVRLMSVVSAVSGGGSSASARLDELKSIEVAPPKPSHGKVRRNSEGHVGRLPASRLDRDDPNVNASVQNPRRSISDPCNGMDKISEFLPAHSGSEQEDDPEKKEHILKMRLLSLQAGLPMTQVHNFGETMVGGSVGDSRRSSRVTSRRPSIAASSRRPSIAASPADSEICEEDPLAALMRQMGATPAPKKNASRRPSKVVLSHDAMSHLSDIKRPASAQSVRSTTTRAPPTSDKATLSAACSPSPAEDSNRGLLALLRRRQNGGNSQPKQKQQVIPGDLSWRKCKRPVVNGSRIKVGKVGRADAGAKAACILLSNTGLSVFNPSMLPG